MLIQNGVRCGGIFTGFLERTDKDNLFRLHQSAYPGSHILVRAHPPFGLPNMAPVDVSGHLHQFGDELGIEATYIDRATPGSIRGCSSFQRLGRPLPPGVDRFVFFPMHKIDAHPPQEDEEAAPPPQEGMNAEARDEAGAKWVLTPFVQENLRDGTSDWGYPGETDPMAGWLSEGIESPPKQRLMNRVLATGIVLSVGRLIDGEDRYYFPLKVQIAEGQPPIECRIDNSIRGYQQLVKSVQSLVAPITISGTLRGYQVDASSRVTYIDTVDIYAANDHDLPGGIPNWMLKAMKARLAMRSAPI